MNEQIFRFKQFAIREHSQVMKVGTDSILLGSWIVHATNGNILDIGAGNGILSLMLAQRNPKAHIVAIDLSQEAADLCKVNFQQNDWSDRMEVQHISLQQFISPHLFDLIVSNPPYFNEGLLAPNLNRARARHSQTLSFEALLKNTSRLLKPDANFYIVLPHHSQTSFLHLATQYELNPSIICDVSSYTDKLPYISMICLRKTSLTHAVDNQHLVIYDGRTREYSSEFKALTEAFYL